MTTTDDLIDSLFAIDAETLRRRSPHIVAGRLRELADALTADDTADAVGASGSTTSSAPLRWRVVLDSESELGILDVDESVVYDFQMSVGALVRLNAICAQQNKEAALGGWASQNNVRRRSHRTADFALYEPYCDANTGEWVTL